MLANNNNKRLHSSLIPPLPQSARNSNKRIKRTTTTFKKSKKSVGFSQSVSMRCFFVPVDVNNDAATSSWIRKEDIDKIKNRARSFSKVHCLIRSSNAAQHPQQASDAATQDVVRTSQKNIIVISLDHY